MKERMSSKFLEMCNLEMKYVIPAQMTWYAGKYIGYGLCSIADAISEFVEVYRDRNSEKHGEVPSVHSNS